MIRGLILDLDDTLFDCTGQLTGAARRRAANILIATGREVARCSIDDLVRRQEARTRDTDSESVIREIGRDLACAAGDIQLAVDAYNRDEVEAIHPFPEVHATLDELSRRGYRLSVVTAGRPHRQQAKLERLGLSSWFSETAGTLWILDDPGADKGLLLQKAAYRMELDPAQVLSVGDKLDADVSVSRRLGMRTARMLEGRQKHRTPGSPDETPDYTLHRLSDLLPLLPPLSP